MFQICGGNFGFSWCSAQSPQRCRLWNQWNPESWSKPCYKTSPQIPHPSQPTRNIHESSVRALPFFALPQTSMLFQMEHFGFSDRHLFRWKHLQQKCPAPSRHRDEPELGGSIRKWAHFGTVQTTCELCHWLNVNNPAQTLNSWVEAEILKRKNLDHNFMAISKIFYC